MPSNAPRPKPPVPVGTDAAFVLKGRGGEALPFSYWDLWFVLVAVNSFAGDLKNLAEHLRGERTGFCREDAVRKLSHLRDLQHRLAGAGVSLATVLDAAGSTLMDTEGRRASGRVLKHNERLFERSEAMLHPPKERLHANALRGMWPRFPVSPEPYAKRLARRFNWDRCHGENASHGLAHRLDSETARAQKLADKGEMAEALAMWRGLMTVALELIAIADDSYGAIGDSFQEAFRHYLHLPREQMGIASEVFLADLLEFLVWEDYGFTYDQTDGYFAHLTEAETDLCLEYLRGRTAALLAIDLDYQAEQALALRGQIVAEQKRFDLFEGLAGEMAARAWKRIVRLVDVAEKAGKRDLAASVFQAALTDGLHLEFLRRKCDQLLHGQWDPDPKK